jgi:hypothetical protein
LVIESRQQYKDLVSKLNNKNVFATAVSDDFRYHPAECDPIVVTIKYNSEVYNIVLDHTESESWPKRNDIDLQDLSKVKRFFVDDAKEFYHLTGLKNCYDSKLLSYFNNEKLEKPVLPYVFEHLGASKKQGINRLVPLTKVIQYSESKLNTISQPKNITKPYLKYNKSLKTFAALEKSGLKITMGPFKRVFKNGYAYSNFNILTTTGRPSNTFRGINLGALNKNDDTRNQIVTRHKPGMLVEFDYDAYHLRLLAKILKYDVPSDVSLHQYFADTIYKSSYDEAKRISWQILYGNVKVTEKENPFFYKVDKMSDALWGYFKKHKHFKSHIYRRQFASSNVPDANKNKVLNYFIQSYETEQNIETIRKIQDFLKSRSTNMIFYTYDSFLFDLDRTEGLEVILRLKKILNAGSFPVKVKAGLNYGEMQDITERINGH